MKILVALDRDNTLHQDDSDGFYGKGETWREKLIFLEGVIEGLQLLSLQPDMHMIVASNQRGVARGMFDEARVREVNQHIDSVLQKLGVRMDGWYFCPYTDEEDARKWERQNIPYNKRYIRRSHLKKPEIGMLEQAAADLGCGLGAFSHIYFVGDRYTDVKTGINAGGKGILIQTAASQHNYEKCVRRQTKYPGKIQIVQTFLDAARFVVSDAYR